MSYPNRMSAGARTGIVGLVIVIVLAIIAFITWQSSSFGSTDGGHVAVVRNGGPFDNTKITEVLGPNSGRTNIGMYSTMHNYPTSQRFFTIDPNGNSDSSEPVSVPTADGITVSIEGTAYFTVNTSSANGYKVLKTFDDQYGTRTYGCAKGGSRNVWDGNTGFSCFLDQIVYPIIKNDLRVSIGDLKCADLQASCSLVQNSNGQIDQSKVGVNNVNLAKVEQEIGTSLQQDLNTTLGGDYLQGIRFNLAKIDLPQALQTAIDSVQANFAKVSEAQAVQKQQLIQSETKLKQALLEAQANEAKQKGYNSCPVCGAIDKLKALPPNLQVLGGTSGVNLNLGK